MSSARAGGEDLGGDAGESGEGVEGMGSGAGVDESGGCEVEGADGVVEGTGVGDGGVEGVEYCALHGGGVGGDEGEGAALGSGDCARGFATFGVEGTGEEGGVDLREVLVGMETEW